MNPKENPQTTPQINGMEGKLRRWSSTSSLNRLANERSTKEDRGNRSLSASPTLINDQPECALSTSYSMVFLDLDNIVLEEFEENDIKTDTEDTEASDVEDSRPMPPLRALPSPVPNEPKIAVDPNLETKRADKGVQEMDTDDIIVIPDADDSDVEIIETESPSGSYSHLPKAVKPLKKPLHAADNEISIISDSSTEDATDTDTDSDVDIDGTGSYEHLPKTRGSRKPQTDTDEDSSEEESPPLTPSTASPSPTHDGSETDSSEDGSLRRPAKKQRMNEEEQCLEKFVENKSPPESQGSPHSPPSPGQDENDNIMRDLPEGFMYDVFTDSEEEEEDEGEEQGESKMKAKKDDKTTATTDTNSTSDSDNNSDSDSDSDADPKGSYQHLPKAGRSRKLQMDTDDDSSDDDAAKNPPLTPLKASTASASETSSSEEEHLPAKKQRMNKEEQRQSPRKVVEKKTAPGSPHSPPSPGHNDNDEIRPCLPEGFMYDVFTDSEEEEEQGESKMKAKKDDKTTATTDTNSTSDSENNSDSDSDSDFDPKGSYQHLPKAGRSRKLQMDTDDDTSDDDEPKNPPLTRLKASTASPSETSSSEEEHLPAKKQRMNQEEQRQSRRKVVEKKTAPGSPQSPPSPGSPQSPPSPGSPHSPPSPGSPHSPPSPGHNDNDDIEPCLPEGFMYDVFTESEDEEEEEEQGERKAKKEDKTTATTDTNSTSDSENNSDSDSDSDFDPKGSYQHLPKAGRSRKLQMDTDDDSSDDDEPKNPPLTRLKASAESPSETSSSEEEHLPAKKQRMNKEEQRQSRRKVVEKNTAPGSPHSPPSPGSAAHDDAEENFSDVQMESQTEVDDPEMDEDEENPPGLPAATVSAPSVAHVETRIQTKRKWLGAGHVSDLKDKKVEEKKEEGEGKPDIKATGAGSQGSTPSPPTNAEPKSNTVAQAMQKEGQAVAEAAQGENRDSDCQLISVTRFDKVDFNNAAHREHLQFITDLQPPFALNPELMVSLQDFKILRLIGRGAFGRVYLVRKLTGHDAGTLYAMKAILMTKVLLQFQLAEHLKVERQVLEAVKGTTFMVGLHYAFKSDTNAYLVMDFVQGGELFSFLRRKGGMTEAYVRLYIAEVVVAIDELHSRNILYMDIKLENILLDADGHIVLADFGLTMILSQDIFLRAHSVCGTVEYMAPEVFDKMPYGYGKAADWWSLGVLAYELLTGDTPFLKPGRDQSKTIRSIRHDTPKIHSFLSQEAGDLLRKLLEKNPLHRLKRASDIQAHPFFKDLNWAALRKRRYAMPYKPRIRGPEDVRNFSRKFVKESVEDIDEGPAPPSGLELFNGYAYVAPQHLEQERRARDSGIEFCNPEVEEIPVLPESLELGLLVAKGAFGKCFQVADNFTGMQVAAKVVHLSMFRASEIDALMSFDHPHILRHHGTFRDRVHIWILTEYLKGTDLSASGVRMDDEPTLRQIFLQLMSAVQHVHSKRFIHGDIKPQNVVFEHADQLVVKLIDFGNASYHTNFESWQDKPRYTLDYAPPELVQDSSPLVTYTPAVDIFGLGATLYALFTGHGPYREDRYDYSQSPEALAEVRLRIQQQQQDDTFNAEPLAERSSAELRTLISGLMQREPENRLKLVDLWDNDWVEGRVLEEPPALRELVDDDQSSSSSTDDDDSTDETDEAGEDVASEDEGIDSEDEGIDSEEGDNEEDD